jgi:multisubunit Na+/H+ antiporter MnhE subunit
MFILRLIIAALIVSYIVWLFYTRIMGKSLSFSKVVSWVLLVIFLIYIILTGISVVVE